MPGFYQRGGGGGNGGSLLAETYTGSDEPRRRNLAGFLFAPTARYYPPKEPIAPLEEF